MRTCGFRPGLAEEVIEGHDAMDFRSLTDSYLPHDGDSGPGGTYPVHLHRVQDFDEAGPDIFQSATMRRTVSLSLGSIGFIGTDYTPRL